MTEKLVDSFGRVVDYIRISVTDRCDFRCVYCMAEEMTFLPRSQVLTLEEIHTIAAAFVSLGVNKIRLTGGEPMVRRGIEGLCADLTGLSGLDELVMTTNGSQLVNKAVALKKAGVKRLNVSLDSLQAERFKQITRTGDVAQVIAGIDAAIAAGFQNLKINAVILRNRNDDEIMELVEFARGRNLDLSFIEEMPLGTITEHDQAQAYMSSDDVKAVISQHYELLDSSRQTPGPSRYFAFADGHKSRIGFISPHSHNFCEACNRVRVTAEGRLLLCLGNEHSVDLKAVLRRYPGDMSRVQQAIRDAMQLKPARHYFNAADEVKILRFMNMTGG